MSWDWVLMGLTWGIIAFTWVSHRQALKHIKGALYYQGRADELAALSALHETEDAYEYMLTVRNQITEALGEKEAGVWVDHNLKINIIDTDD